MSVGKDDHDREKRVLNELKIGTPWQQIAKKYHMSPKTIQKIGWR